MAIEITIPRLGWSMDEGLFAEWVKCDGEFIKAGEPIFLLETEKALQEVESVDSGYLHVAAEGPQPGETVRVGTLIGWLLTEGEQPPQKSSDHRQRNKRQPTSSATKQSSAPSIASGSEANTPAMQTCGASPAVRRLARELNVDLATLAFSGTISEFDVRRAAERRTGSIQLQYHSRGAVVVPRRNSEPGLPNISPRAARTAALLGVDWTLLKGTGQNGRIREQDVRAEASVGLPEGNLVEASSVRKLIAQRLAQSVRQTVPVTMMRKLRVDMLVADRAARKTKSDSATAVPAVHDYLLSAVARALHEFPSLIQRWYSGQILQPTGIHIGLAVDTSAGLIVPVVKHANRCSLTELARLTGDLIHRARVKKLKAEETQGGTFTVSNLGSYGIEEFTPVINLGESAILGVGAIQKYPVCGSDDQLLWSSQMTVSLTFDHQVIDGVPAAQFLSRIDELLNTADAFE